MHVASGIVPLSMAAELLVFSRRHFAPKPIMGTLSASHTSIYVPSYEKRLNWYAEHTTLLKQSIHKATTKQKHNQTYTISTQKTHTKKDKKHKNTKTTQTQNQNKTTEKDTPN